MNEYGTIEITKCRRIQMAHSVGKTIAKLRKEKGWTQAELAEKIGLTDKAVSKWESDNGLPDTTIFPTLAEIFGVSIDYLMTGPKEHINSVNNMSINNMKAISVEEQEKKIAETIHNGIINIDELLATKDFQLIKKGILENPIHPFELDFAQIKNLYEALENKNWRELFVYSVDNKDIENNFTRQNMAKSIINNNSEDVKSHIDNIAKTLVEKWNTSYDRYGSYNRKTYSSPNYIRLRNDSRTPNLYSLQNIYDYLNKYKQQVIEDASLKWDKEKTVGNLTKEYFNTELSNGNIEIVIIKLCVRLEAILKSDYHYEGDFADMLKRYCDEHGSEDDDWGYSQESNFVKYLHKLRKQRNSIVHSEKIDEQMTESEINFCIDYICNMG